MTAQSEAQRQQDNNRHAWTVKDWCRAMSIGPTTLYGLIAAGEIESVKLNKKRLILTAPGTYTARLRAGA